MKIKSFIINFIIWFIAIYGSAFAIFKEVFNINFLAWIIFCALLSAINSFVNKMNL
ncbi:MAG: hypothetical protein SFT90_03995 [Rickettsiales bacterium]|nr:hypothetical protein [Rickettsiales bacterium]